MVDSAIFKAVSWRASHQLPPVRPNDHNQERPGFDSTCKKASYTLHRLIRPTEFTGPQIADPRSDGHGQAQCGVSELESDAGQLRLKQRGHTGSNPREGRSSPSTRLEVQGLGCGLGSADAERVQDRARLATH